MSPMPTGARAGICEDDDELRGVLRSALERDGFAVRATASGTEALAAFSDGALDVLVLDVGLPDADGRDVCQALRARGVAVPVLFLTALDALPDRLSGFHAGGDDYLTKPFDFLELTARLDVLLRRPSAPPREATLRAGKLEMDLLSHAVRYAGRVVELLPREYRLLEFLMRHAGQVVTRTMLFEEVWNYRSVGPTNVIDMHISKLRRKLDPESSESMIWTIRGAGYMLRATG
jgi:two-component system OmpR family response regulator